MLDNTATVDNDMKHFLFEHKKNIFGGYYFKKLQSSNIDVLYYNGFNKFLNKLYHTMKSIKLYNNNITK